MHLKTRVEAASMDDLSSALDVLTMRPFVPSKDCETITAPCLPMCVPA